MLIGIAAFEWRYVTRRVTFAAAAIVLAGLGFVLAKTGFGAQDIHVNSPYAVAYSIAFLSLTSVFALTVLVAPSLLRDTEHHMAEIVYSTAVTKTEYLLGRLAGSFLAAAAAFVFGVAGMVAGALTHEPERIAAYQPMGYAWAFAVLALPSMAFVAALLFTIAAVTRSTLATYIGGVVVYVLYFAAAVVAGSPLLASSGPVSAQEMAIAALVDPFGLSAIFEQTRYWTAAERDVRRLALSGSLLVNRVIWTVAAAALVALAHRAFAFRVVSGRRRAEQDEIGPVVVAEAYRPATVATSTPAAALVSSIRLEAGALLRSWPFVAVLILWAGSAFMTVFEELRRAEYGTALFPTAGLIVQHLGQPLLLFGVLVIVYFAGELVWRERMAGVAEIVDATPASSAVFLVSKTIALWILIGVLIAVAIAVGMVLQLTSGYRPMQPHLLASLFWFGGAPLALFAVLAILIQAVAPNRHAGLLGTMAAAVVLPLGGPGAPDHPLLRYGFAGTVPYSEMNGFGPAATVFASLVAYWSAFAGLLAVFAIGIWRRGTDVSLAKRLRHVRRGLGRPAQLVAIACVLAWLGLGGRLFHQMNVVSAYQTADDRAAWRVDYERAYADVDARPQPAIAHIEAAFDLHPAERRYGIRGRYRLANRTGETITSVTVTMPSGVRVSAMTLDGRPPSGADERLRVRTFEASMAPGASGELAFALEVDRGPASVGVEHDIVGNGSFVFGASVLPALGYRRAYEIDDPVERRRRGLPEQAVRPPSEPHLATFDLVVTAPADQVIVAPGIVRETGVTDGRGFTRFSVDRPVQPILAVAAARYAIARTRVGEIDVEVLHHPGHAVNVARIVAAAARSLEYCIRAYGPYPYPTLRIAETPAYDDRFGGYALPGVVYLTEDRAFLTDQRDASRTDIVTKRTAHEVAHQWWGHQAAPAAGPGASAVVETTARYTELMVLKERYGEAAVRPTLVVELGRYLAGRRGEAEVPLDRVENQAYIYYAKGALVMTALQALIGEARVNEGLRSVIARVNAGGSQPTASDLGDALRAVTPAEHRAQLEEWWSGVVLYDLRVASARAARLADGRFRVDARIEGTRTERVEGAETTRPIADAVEIAVYADHPDRSDAPPLYVGRHDVHGTADVSVTVSAEPRYVVVDPNLRRIDRNPDDNLRRVE